MDFLNYLFSAAAWWIWTLLALAAVAMIYSARHSSFAVTELFYTFPLIGRLSRFSNDYSNSTQDAEWLNVENTLCRDYAKHCTSLSPEEFDNNIEYLKRTYDHGRREIPVWVMGLLALLIALEGLGFSYLLGGFMAMEGSENTRQLLMVGIVLVLATILVWVTHHAGHQWFRTSLLRYCFREYQKNKDPCFTSRVVSLDEAQTIDDADPPHVRCANRVVSKPGDVGNHAWAWIAGVLILSIAIGSTVLRLETLHTAQIEEAQLAAAPSGPDVSGLSPELQAAVATPAPATPAADPAAASKENAALAGFIMLAIIFVVTQLVGVGVGLRYGFAGKQSRQASRATRGQPDYGSYFEPIERRMMIANARLLKLHQLLEKHSPTPIDFKKNFYTFIAEEQKKGATNLHLPEERLRSSPVRRASRGNGHDTGRALGYEHPSGVNGSSPDALPPPGEARA